MLAALVLSDFAVSDNDGLYTLITLVAVALAFVLIVTVVRQSRASDRRLHAPAVTPPPAIDETSTTPKQD